MIEASAITEDGEIVPSSSVGMNRTYVDHADKVIIEVNEWQSEGLYGMHDIYYPIGDLPPKRVPLPILNAGDRIGDLTMKVDPEKVVGIIVTDAPDRNTPFKPLDDDSLVVHQQDIQAVVNALWAGGAEAITIQNQRVIATTGIKCVGNSVVLHGIPYAPPYVIQAIGDPSTLSASLEGTKAIQIYRQYVDAYGLGYEATVVDHLELPAFEGAVGVSHARRG